MLTLRDPKDCSLSGSFVHGDSPGKNTGVGCHALLQGIFPTPGLEPKSPTLQVDSLPSEPPGKFKNTRVAYPFSRELPHQGIKSLRSPALQADIFTSWATRKALFIPILQEIKLSPQFQYILCFSSKLYHSSQSQYSCILFLSSPIISMHVLCLKKPAHTCSFCCSEKWTHICLSDVFTLILNQNKLRSPA